MGLGDITKLWNKTKWVLLVIGRFVLYILLIAFLFALLISLLSCRKYREDSFKHCDKIIVLYTSGTIRLSTGQRLKTGMCITDYDTIIVSPNSSTGLVKACGRYKRSIVRHIEAEGKHPISLVFM